MWRVVNVFAAVGFAYASAQGPVEPANFDVANALLQHNIDVSTVPGLSNFSPSERSSACSIACSALQHIFGNNVLQSNTSAYEAFTSSYWSAQQVSVDPQCIFKPTVSKDVSILVLVARLTQCPFAVKSGGHAAFAGASSSPGGITVSFDNMKGVSLSEDKSVVGIEPGNTWYDVYAALEPENLAVVGGRVSAIGVGGLTLGGGISFFSSQYGWACDNVASYDIVTASGALISVSPTTHADLYQSLRGGGNNFGIVTKFHLETISQGPMWGGARLHLEPQFPALVDAFYKLGTQSALDPAAAQILSFAYAQNTKIASSELEYAKPISNASIFADYLAIPAFQDGTAVRSLANLTLQMNESNPNGLREIYWVATFKLDRELTSFISDVFYEEVLRIADAAALVPAMTLQVITVPMLKNFAKKGGNALGLEEGDGPLLLMLSNTMWKDEADDERILATNKRIVDRSIEEGKKKGLFVEYIYQNYASKFQAVLPSYGKESHERLKAVAKKYDPKAVFQQLQPGYFKLDGAPAAWEA